MLGGRSGLRVGHAMGWTEDAHALSYSRPETADDDVYRQRARDVNRMGATASPPTLVRHFDWPYVPTTSMIDGGFFDQLAAAQGRHHVAVCNETTCGLGLLNLSNGVDRLVALLEAAGERHSAA